MKIVSWNVNGLRAVYKKGFLGWLEKSGADIVCLQETKAQEDQLDFFLKYPAGYFAYFSSAKRKGYSGVAVYAKKEPLIIKRSLGFTKFDGEGRVLHLEYADFSLINLYLPHGGRDKSKLVYKLKAYEYLFKFLKTVKKPVISIGDFNIAHQEIDLARSKDNQKNIMFTPQERKQIDRLINMGFVDSFREFHQGGGYYTWWPYRLDARERNLGWRIDYCFISKNLVPKLKAGFILSQVKGSDHCPVGIEISPLFF